MCSLIQVYVLHKLFCSVSGFVCNSDIQHSIFWQLFMNHSFFFHLKTY